MAEIVTAARSRTPGRTVFIHLDANEHVREVGG